MHRTHDHRVPERHDGGCADDGHRARREKPSAVSRTASSRAPIIGRVEDHAHVTDANVVYALSGPAPVSAGNSYSPDLQPRPRIFRPTTTPPALVHPWRFEATQSPFVCRLFEPAEERPWKPSSRIFTYLLKSAFSSLYLDFPRSPKRIYPRKSRAQYASTLSMIS